MESWMKVEKIQVYKSAHHQFIYNFVLYSLTTLITCLFISYPFWFPSMKNIIVSFPYNKISSFFNAKCLFILGNIIVFILIGESMLARPSSSYPASDIYDEYAARSRRRYKVVNPDNNINLIKKNEEEPLVKEDHQSNHVFDEEKKKEMRVCKSTTSSSMQYHHHVEKKKELRVCKSTSSEVWGESEINVKRKATKGRKIEDDIYIPTEELNKRVEDFIARVNKQRLLEAKLAYLN